MARWLQYRYCYCYLSWPLSYFISSLRFCQFLAANRYKNSPLLVMKDIKMQTRLWAHWAGFFPFAAFAAYHWPQRNKTLGSKRMKERTWVTNDRSVLPFEEVRETLTGFAIKFSFIPLPIPWEIAVQIFAFLWDNEVALVSMEDIQLYRELIFFSTGLIDTRMMEGQMIIHISMYLYLTCAVQEALCCHQTRHTWLLISWNLNLICEMDVKHAVVYGVNEALNWDVCYEGK